MKHLLKNIPIITRDNDGMDKILGTTTSDCHIVVWDTEKQECRVTIDGKLFYGGTSCIVNELQNGVVTDFEIESIGITT